MSKPWWRSIVVIAVPLVVAAGCGGPGPADGATRDALSTARYLEEVPTTVESAYGDAPEQFGTLSVPEGDGPHPVVVLVHGGFWRARYRLDLMDPLVDDLVRRGWAAWNIEYRRVAQPGGGYPGTLVDVAAAVDHLAELAETYPLDLDRLAVVGHSAGGHLALWAGSRRQLQPGDPGAAPVVEPRLVVGLAAVADLRRAAIERLGDGATQDFLGGEPDELAERYRVAQPMLHSDRTALVHGSADTVVPVDQSLRFRDDGVAVAVIDGDDHFSVIDPDSRSWEATLAFLQRI